jgi:hypothetical protein
MRVQLVACWLSKRRGGGEMAKCEMWSAGVFSGTTSPTETKICGKGCSTTRVLPAIWEERLFCGRGETYSLQYVASRPQHDLSFDDRPMCCIVVYCSGSIL